MSTTKYRMPPIDDSSEEAVTTCFSYMFLIGFLPIFLAGGILYSPYFIYKGVRAATKKCTTSSPPAESPRQ